MAKFQTGVVSITNLPGTGSLFHRSWLIYKHTFSTLVWFSLLMALGFFVSSGINAALQALVHPEAQALKIFSQIFITLIDIGIGLYYAYIFAAMIGVVHEWGDRRVLLTVPQGLQWARTKFISVFWVGLILAFVLYGILLAGGIVAPFLSLFFVFSYYGSLVIGILGPIFTIWFYFSVYVVLLDKERGVNALAKSRYLIHGLFFKVIIRYITIFLVLVASLIPLYLVLGIPAIGGVMAALLFTAYLLIFAIPFFTVYEYLRYEDLLLVERTLPFKPFHGERNGIITLAVCGALLFTLGWTTSMLDIKSQIAIYRPLVYFGRTVLVPFAAEVEKNLNSVSFLFGSPATPSQNSAGQQPSGKLDEVPKTPQNTYSTQPSQ